MHTKFIVFLFKMHNNTCFKLICKITYMALELTLQPVCNFSYKQFTKLFLYVAFKWGGFCLL